MNGFGNQFLAGAAFAADEHGRAGGPDLRHKIKQGEHLVAFSDNVREIEALLQGALQLNIFIAQTASLNCLGNLREKLIVRQGFGNVVHRAVFEGSAGNFNRAVGGDQHNRQVRIVTVDVLQKFNAVAVRQTHVQQKEIEWLFFEPRKT